jgi:peroxiredoxin
MYLNLVDKNEQVVVQRGKDKAYKIVPVIADDICMTEVEFYAKIDNSIRQVDAGQVIILSKDRQKELLGL